MFEHPSILLALLHFHARLDNLAAEKTVLIETLAPLMAIIKYYRNWIE